MGSRKLLLLLVVAAASRARADDPSSSSSSTTPEDGGGGGNGDTISSDEACQVLIMHTCGTRRESAGPTGLLGSFFSRTTTTKKVTLKMHGNPTSRHHHFQVEFVTLVTFQPDGIFVGYSRIKKNVTLAHGSLRLRSVTYMFPKRKLLRL